MSREHDCRADQCAALAAGKVLARVVIVLCEDAFDECELFIRNEEVQYRSKVLGKVICQGLPASTPADATFGDTRSDVSSWQRRVSNVR
jgi:hypothetical protein